MAIITDTNHPSIRKPFKLPSKLSYYDGVKLIEEQLGNSYLNALDIIEQLIDIYNENSVELLVLAYEIYLTLPNEAKDSRFYLYQARHFNFIIENGQHVLDVGSGHIPFPLATHLSDISTNDDSYGRAGTPFKFQDGKPVYECNVESLPFNDNEFEFVYCSHVLEHVHDPLKAVAELTRVARRGYIETPTEAKDLFLNTSRQSNHIWGVSVWSNSLRFKEYSDEIKDGLKCNILMDMHCAPQSDREKAFSALILLKSKSVNTMVMWEQDLKVIVERN